MCTWNHNFGKSFLLNSRNKGDKRSQQVTNTTFENALKNTTEGTISIKKYHKLCLFPNFPHREYDLIFLHKARFENWLKYCMGYFDNYNRIWSRTIQKWIKTNFSVFFTSFRTLVLFEQKSFEQKLYYYYSIPLSWYIKHWMNVVNF